MKTKNPNQKKNPKNLIHSYIIHPFQEFFHIEAMGGILLMFTSITALVWANSPLAHSYHHIWEISFRIGLGEFAVDKSLHHWINDGLMAIFFFLVGLEIKREFLAGELASAQKLILPLAAALGGMVVPALFFVSLNVGTEAQMGWGIPMATDIAFALGALALLGAGVPPALIVFLTALAIVDDLGGVLVIALFYGEKIALSPLISGFFILLISILCNKGGIRKPMVYVILGIALWLAFLKSGIHATVAGVLLAMTIPTNAQLTGNQFAKRIQGLLDDFSRRQRVDDPLSRAEDQQAAIQEIELSCRRVEAPLQRIEHGLHPWVTYIILPIFAFANAGTEIPFQALGGALSDPIVLGVILGLIFGKQLGIMSFCWVTVKFGWTQLPQGVGWPQLYGVSILAGIGFTMSLFIADLAFPNPEYLQKAKIGILVASILSGVIGYFFLKKVTQGKNG